MIIAVQEVQSIIDLAAKLSTVGFGTLMLLILFGSFFDIWLWGKKHRADMAAKDKQIEKLEADCTARMAALQTRHDQLFELALRSAGALETSLTKRIG